MARHYSEQLQSLIDNGNCASLACLGEYSLEELREQLGDEAHTTDLTALHNEIRGACDLALIEKKNAIIGASPLLPSAMQDVDEPPIEALPEAAAATGPSARVRCRLRPMKFGGKIAPGSIAAPGTSVRCSPRLPT